MIFLFPLIGILLFRCCCWIYSRSIGFKFFAHLIFIFVAYSSWTAFYTRTIEISEVVGTTISILLASTIFAPFSCVGFSLFWFMSVPMKFWFIFNSQHKPIHNCRARKIGKKWCSGKKHRKWKRDSGRNDGIHENKKNQHQQLDKNSVFGTMPSIGSRAITIMYMFI